MAAAVNAATLPAWWEAVLCRRLGLASLEADSLHPFVAPLARLSAHLNALDERDDIASTYMRDVRLRQSYQLYYVTANLLKPLWALERLWPSGPPPGSGPLRVLDLGCGPGTGVAALHAWLERSADPRPLRVRGIDVSEAAAREYRAMGADIAAVTGLAVEADAGAGDASRSADALRAGLSDGTHDLVMAMNLYNELPSGRQEGFLARCAQLLAPGGILLLIEPALRQTSRGLLRLRDQAVREGWRVTLPCFRQGECPALAQEKDWCHHDMEWERPAFIAWLDEEIGNIKKSLKFSCIVLEAPDAAGGAGTRPRDSGTKARETAQPAALRVVSELFVEKGRTWCHMCGAAGRRVYQRNRRDHSEANASFDGLRRYDAVRIEHAEERAHDVRITGESTVRTVD